MSNIAKVVSGEITQFDPTKSHARVAAFDAARRHAKAIKDWDALAEAVREEIAEQKEFVEWWDTSVRERGKRSNVLDRGHFVPDIEQEFKIKKQQVSRWRKALKNIEKYQDELRGPSYKKAMCEKTVRGSEGTGDEWYTPAEYVGRAREVLGEIDLDPASSVVAQHTVGAREFFTLEDNGLKRDWRGRVWLNPPYAQPLIAQFITKLVTEFTGRCVTEAVLLVNNCTDTAWFHEAANTSNAICFTRGRIQFREPDGDIGKAPAQGQAFLYFGFNVKKFIDVFQSVGFVVVCGRREILR